MRNALWHDKKLQFSFTFFLIAAWLLLTCISAQAETPDEITSDPHYHLLLQNDQVRVFARFNRARIRAEPKSCSATECGQTQGIRTDFGVAIVRGFRRRKGIGKALDDRVLGIPGRSRMRGVFGTTSKALGGNLEAGNAVNGVPDTPILCRDGKGNIEMYERQRDAVLRGHQQAPGTEPARDRIQARAPL